MRAMLIVMGFWGLMQPGWGGGPGPGVYPPRGVRPAPVVRWVWRPWGAVPVWEVPRGRGIPEGPFGEPEIGLPGWVGRGWDE